MKNKRGMELPIGTIVIIIISLVLLVGLIFMFVGTERNFFETVQSYVSDSNVDAIVTSCNTAADTEASYEYCCVKKQIRLDKKDEFEMTCSEASAESWGNRISDLDCGEEVC